MTAKRLALVRWICGLFDHRGAQWLMDITGEFGVQDCTRCGTMIIQSLFEGHSVEDYEHVLDRWFVDWRVT